MLIALTRELSPSISRCELTYGERRPIDLALAHAQHDAYEASLRGAGCAVQRLAAGPDMPDSVFIEDTAVVFGELAIVTRPGAESRRVETGGVADALRPHRELRCIDTPGVMDGGDVLVVGRHIFVGRSKRTNDAGIQQMRRLLAPHRYEVSVVDVRGCLHLKSAVTALGDDLLLTNPAWLPAHAFASFDRVDVHPGEPSAANALRIGATIIYSTSFPRTLERLQRRGLAVAAVDTSELEKAEGALTCCSLIFESKD